ncbi:MAG: hypothetical protein IJL96_09650 [Clostridia bacterium]|nr:hypothetical protein [Clostridia bacterium]
MLRLFQEHRVRDVEDLSGVWKFAPQGNPEWVQTVVPGVWETMPDYRRYRGEADYVRELEIRKPGNYLLRFGGVSHTADVFLDEVHIGHHYNAFTGFDCVLEQLKAGRHTLRVHVDNRYSEDSCLHVPNDYETYGGISRPVELHCLSEVQIERMSIQTFRTDEVWKAEVTVFVRAFEETRDAVLLVHAGPCTEQIRFSLGRNEEKALPLTLTSREFAPWAPEHPVLYTASAEIRLGERTVDDLQDRFGFREVAVQGEAILLNGQRIQIRGFNRHEDYGDFGCSVPLQAMMQDLSMMKTMGANAVRTCHYPNDMRFLDLCDELGMMVWEENHARAVPASVFHSPRFMEQCRQCNEEMVHQHGNHPSILIWGLLNECESETEAGRAIYAEQIAQLRALDPTRPVSFASCRCYTDICLDLVDIVSFNIYPQWYQMESVKTYMDRLLCWMEENGAAGKPILITEVGAGAIAGFHDPFGKAMWSEERQADILEEQLTVLQHERRLSGTFIWQFADVPVDESWAHRRPKQQNNKGVVDRYRRPKAAFETVRKIYGETLNEGNSRAGTL